MFMKMGTVFKEDGHHFHEDGQHVHEDVHRVHEDGLHVHSLWEINQARKGKTVFREKSTSQIVNFPHNN